MRECGRGSGLLIVQLQLQLEQRKAQRSEGDKEQLELHLGWGCQLAAWHLGGSGCGENFSGLAEHGNESCSSRAAVQGDGELPKQIDLKNANNSAFEESFKKT